MPRPNPPRKRPRKWPAGERVRADAALTKQTAQSTQPKAQAPPQRGGGDTAAVAAAAPAPDEMWTRRSYAVLVAVMGAVSILVTALQWGFSPAKVNGVAKASLGDTLAVFQPLSLVVASILAAPIAKRITGERRPLRFVESLMVGVVAFFVIYVIVLALSLATTPPGGGGGTGTTCGSSRATPVPESGSAAPGTPCPSPSPGSQPSSPRASPSPSSAASLATTSGVSLTPAQRYGVDAAVDVLTLAGTWYLYPPLYRRLRVRRPPPQRAKGGGGKSGAQRR